MTVGTQRVAESNTRGRHAKPWNSDEEPEFLDVVAFNAAAKAFQAQAGSPFRTALMVAIETYAEALS